MKIEHCFSCGKLRPVKKTGEYKYKGETFDIVCCQWCRGAIVRRKNAKLPNPYIKRKGGLKE